MENINDSDTVIMAEIVTMTPVESKRFQRWFRRFMMNSDYNRNYPICMKLFSVCESS